MTELEIKKKLIGKISRMKNEYLLQEVYRLIENEESGTDIYTFSEDEWNAIKEAKNQYRSGKYLNSEDADKEIDEWLGE
jgi:hypothetical protein